ncbi:MAG: MFS transporter, partial [Pseudomonadota bacterium]
MNRNGIALAGVCASMYVLLGVQLPYFSGWLATRGFSAPEIGWLTGISLALRLALGPPFAFWVDRQADQRSGLRVASLIFATAAIALAFSPPKIFVFVAGALVFWSFGMLVPLSDAALLRAQRAGALHFGQTRALGSAAFLAATLIGGGALGAFGDNAGVVMMAAAGAATAVFAFSTPRINLVEGGGP